jgi:hypothetical protein
MNYSPALDGSDTQGTREKTFEQGKVGETHRIFVSDLASSAQHASKCSMLSAIRVISDKFEIEFTLWAILSLMWVESNVSSDCGGFSRTI